jgi:phosphoadenylyl-sulfate reductase (thioredoxin)
MLVDIDRKAIDKLADELEGKTATDAVSWAVERFRDRLAICTSFGPEGIVILDLVRSLNPKIQVRSLDTGRWPSAIYELIQRCEEHFGIRVKLISPEPDQLCTMVREHGINLSYKSVDLRQLCCRVRKVGPLERALVDKDAWVTGLRRDQARSRSNVRKVDIDEIHPGLVKICPLADWTADQVWLHIHERSLPYNRLHDAGFSSIGCEPCTRPRSKEGDERSGRWFWETDSVKECGIHAGSQFEMASK